jgi:hypothetical protein
MFCCRNPGLTTIYALANWLNALGLKLTVAVAEDEGEESGSVSAVELVEVAKV